MAPRHAETEIEPGRDEGLGCQPIRKPGGNACRVKTDKWTPNELKLRWVLSEQYTAAAQTFWPACAAPLQSTPIKRPVFGKVIDAPAVGGATARGSVRDACRPGTDLTGGAACPGVNRCRALLPGNISGMNPISGPSTSRTCQPVKAPSLGSLLKVVPAIICPRGDLSETRNNDSRPCSAWSIGPS